MRINLDLSNFLLAVIIKSKVLPETYEEIVNTRKVD